MPTEPEKAICPQCHATASYQTFSPSGGWGFNLLPALGGLVSAEIDVFVCAECGLIRLFASRDARKKLAESSWWNKVRSTGE